MAIWKSLGLGGQLAAGAVAAIAVLGGGYVLWTSSNLVVAPSKTVEQAEVAPSEAATKEVKIPEGAAAEPKAVEVAPALAEAPTATTPEPVEPPEMLVPAFDVVRVEPDGSALIAGQADAQSAVFILVDTKETATAQTDGAGRFVALFTLEPSDQPRVVTLLARMPDGREKASKDSVVLAPTPKPEVAVAEVTPEPVVEATPEPAVAAATEPVAAATPEPVAEAPTESVAEAKPAEAAATPEAPAVLLADESGVKVLQPAGDLLPETVVIDTIAYDADGQVILGGRGQGGAALQVYLDNAPSIATRIAADGGWTTPLPGVPPGIYTLRVDQLDEAGKVTSRYETPFKREDPSALADLNAPAEEPKTDPVADAASEPAATAEPVEVAKAEPVAQAPVAAEPPAVIADAKPEEATPASEPAQSEPAQSQPAQPEVIAAEPVVEPVKVPEVAPAVEVGVAEAAPAPATEAASQVVAPVADAPAPEVADATQAPQAPAATQSPEPVANVEPATEPAASTDVASAAPAPAAEPSPAAASAEPTAGPTIAEPTPTAELAADPAPADLTEGIRVRIVTVQPGFTLWRIANEAYGNGVMYVQVWDANKQKIKNPDLIYPGQVFTVPEPAN